MLSTLMRPDETAVIIWAEMYFALMCGTYMYMCIPEWGDQLYDRPVDVLRMARGCVHVCT